MSAGNNNLRNLATPGTKTIAFAKIKVPTVPEKVTDKDAWAKWQVEFQKNVDKGLEQLSIVIGTGGAT